MKTSQILLMSFVLVACGVETKPNPHFDAGGGSGGSGGSGATSGSGGSSGTGGTSGSGGTSGTGGVGGDPDAGEDSGTDADAGDAMTSPCSVTCGGDTPHCDETSMTCVACLNNGHCTGNSDGEVCSNGACVECTSAEGCASPFVCEEGGHECVACNESSDCAGNVAGEHCFDHTCVPCLGDDDCTTAGAARCDTATHQCTSCSESEQCDDVIDANVELPVCIAGTCVQCTADDETHCGSYSCNPATNRCTTTPRMSVGTCGACLADSECMNAQARCVPMSFNGTPRPGGYCLRQKGNTDCARPFRVLINEGSLSGAPPEEYCGVAQSLTTCEAVLDLIDDTDCSGDSSLCGATGLDDGVCATVGGAANKCTYACDDAAQCTGSRTCTIDDPYCH